MRVKDAGSTCRDSGDKKYNSAHSSAALGGAVPAPAINGSHGNGVGSRNGSTQAPQKKSWVSVAKSSENASEQYDIRGRTSMAGSNHIGRHAPQGLSKIEGDMLDKLYIYLPGRLHPPSEPQANNQSIENYTEMIRSPAPVIEPRGLVNDGYSCFMNSVIHPLIFCPPFYNYFRRYSSGIISGLDRNTPVVNSM